MTRSTPRSDRILTGAVIAVVLLLVGYNVVTFFGAGLFIEGSAIEPLTGREPGSGRIKTLNIPDSGTAVVNFWATWCAACVKEVSDLNEIRKTVPVYGVLKQPVNTDQFRTIDPRFPSVIAENDLFDSYMVASLPTTFLVRDGTIVRVHVGAVTAETIRLWLSDE